MTKTTEPHATVEQIRCDLLKIHYLCGDKDNFACVYRCCRAVVICSKFITFAVTKTTHLEYWTYSQGLWFAQNSLPLRWQRQPRMTWSIKLNSCDLLKIHYLCGDKDNASVALLTSISVVICSKFITFAVTKTTLQKELMATQQLWFAQNSLPLRWQRQPGTFSTAVTTCCDLLKIHYLCGDKDNTSCVLNILAKVVICSKFITFAVTKTTNHAHTLYNNELWFAQNSLPLRWQRQLRDVKDTMNISCDLLKIHYLCGDKDNSKRIDTAEIGLWFAQNSLPLRWQRQPWSLVIMLCACCDLLKIHYLCGDKDNLTFATA